MRQVISSFIFVFDFAKIPMMSIIVSAAGSSMVRISFEDSLFTSVESPFVLGSCALGSLTAEGFAERTWTLDSCLSTSDLVRVEVKLKVGGPGKLETTIQRRPVHRWERILPVGYDDRPENLPARFR